MLKQVNSKERVTNHGEVYTRKREVNAMLDLVKQETDRIESRFLEPACGTGNFLLEVLDRKFKIVESRYKRSQVEFERYAILAVGSLYGIDILEDNIETCRNRLFYLFDELYTSIFQKRSKNSTRDVVQFILSRNIIRGDALTLQTIEDYPKPIIFSEWSLVRGSSFKRRDFAFHELIPDENEELPLFTESKQKSDLGDEVFIPESIKDFPLTHFSELPDAESN